MVYNFCTGHNLLLVNSTAGIMTAARTLPVPLGWNPLNGTWNLMIIALKNPKITGLGFIV